LPSWPFLPLGISLSYSYYFDIFDFLLEGISSVFVTPLFLPFAVLLELTGSSSYVLVVVLLEGISLRCGEALPLKLEGPPLFALLGTSSSLRVLATPTFAGISLVLTLPLLFWGKPSGGLSDYF